MPAVQHGSVQLLYSRLQAGRIRLLRALACGDGHVGQVDAGQVGGWVMGFIFRVQAQGIPARGKALQSVDGPGTGHAVPYIRVIQADVMFGIHELALAVLHLYPSIAGRLGKPREHLHAGALEHQFGIRSGLLLGGRFFEVTVAQRLAALPFHYPVVGGLRRIVDFIQRALLIRLVLIQAGDGVAALLPGLKLVLKNLVQRGLGLAHRLLAGPGVAQQSLSLDQRLIQRVQAGGGVRAAVQHVSPRHCFGQERFCLLHRVDGLIYQRMPKAGAGIVGVAGGHAGHAHLDGMGPVFQHIALPEQFPGDLLRVVLIHQHLRAAIHRDGHLAVGAVHLAVKFDLDALKSDGVEILVGTALFGVGVALARHPGGWVLGIIIYAAGLALHTSAGMLDAGDGQRLQLVDGGAQLAGRLCQNGAGGLLHLQHALGKGHRIIQQRQAARVVQGTVQRLGIRQQQLQRQQRVLLRRFGIRQARTAGYPGGRVGHRAHGHFGLYVGRAVEHLEPVDVYPALRRDGDGVLTRLQRGALPHLLVGDGAVFRGIGTAQAARRPPVHQHRGCAAARLALRVDGQLGTGKSNSGGGAGFCLVIVALPGVLLAGQPLPAAAVRNGRVVVVQGIAQVGLYPDEGFAGLILLRAQVKAAQPVRHGGRIAGIHQLPGAGQNLGAHIVVAVKFPLAVFVSELGQQPGHIRAVGGDVSDRIMHRQLRALFLACIGGGIHLMLLGRLGRTGPVALGQQVGIRRPVPFTQVKAEQAVFQPGQLVGGIQPGHQFLACRGAVVQLHRVQVGGNSERFGRILFPFAVDEQDIPHIRGVRGLCRHQIGDPGFMQWVAPVAVYAGTAPQVHVFASLVLAHGGHIAEQVPFQGTHDALVPRQLGQLQPVLFYLVDLTALAVAGYDEVLTQVGVPFGNEPALCFLRLFDGRRPVGVIVVVPTVHVRDHRGLVHLLLDGQAAGVQFLGNPLALPAFLNGGVIQVALVGDNAPHHDAGMVAVPLYHLLSRVTKLLPAGGILPAQGFLFHQDAQPVAGIQERRVSLVMAGAHKVDPQVVFQGLGVLHIQLFRQRVAQIGGLHMPVAAYDLDALPVQGKIALAVAGAGGLKSAQPDACGLRIQQHAPCQHLCFHRIQVGIVRTPQMRGGDGVLQLRQSGLLVGCLGLHFLHRYLIAFRIPHDGTHCSLLGL